MQKNPNLRILYITSRIALTEEQKSKLPTDFTFYTDLTPKEEKQIINYQLFACSIQSLHLAHFNYDLVVCDEMETVLGSFSGDAKCHIHAKENNLCKNWDTFLDVLKRAEKVIVIDGLLSKLSVDFLQEIRGNVHIISSKYKQSPRHIKFCSSKIETFYDQIYKSIDAGDKIFLGMSNKGENSDKMNTVESLTSTLISKYGWTLGKEIISYHSLKKKEKKELI